VERFVAVAEPATEPPASGEDAPLEPLNLAPVARILTIGGLVLVIVSAFLEWAGRNYLAAFNGFEVPAKFVVDSEANIDGGGLPIGVVVVVVGAIGLVGVFAPIRWRTALVWGAGVVAAVIALLFLYQLNEFMDRVNQFVRSQGIHPGGFGARNTVGFGAALCGFGGMVTLAGAALGVYVARRPKEAT
jgi:hypothetical protein